MKEFMVFLSLLVSLSACVVREDNQINETYKVAFFVAGQLQGSPPLESLFQGLKELESQLGDKYELNILEAGYDQSEWDLKFKKLVASTKADLYVTSNPSMTTVVEEVAKAYPSKHFIVFESKAINLTNVVTVDFCSEELAFLEGAHAATFLKELYPYTPHYIGIIVGQEYPKMDDIIHAFRQGFNQNIGENAKVSYQVLGNWYDAERARQISAQLYESGVKAILTIAGLANQGVVQAAKEKGKYVMFYENDPNDPVLAQDIVIFSGFIDYKTPVNRLVKSAYETTLKFGEHYQYSVQEGILGFLKTTPHLKKNLELMEK